MDATIVLTKHDNSQPNQ